MNRMTQTSKNITFPKLRLWVVIRLLLTLTTGLKSQTCDKVVMASGIWKFTFPDRVKTQGNSSQEFSGRVKMIKSLDILNL